MITLFELTVVYQYECEGNVQPLVDYLRSELKDEVIKEFLAKVLLGKIKKGDKRRARNEARHLAEAFRIRRLCADHGEREHGDPHVTDADIYAKLDIEGGYKYDTAERMIKRERSKKPKRG